MEIYVVKPGDNIDEIAARYSIAPETLIYDNQLVPPYELAIGQALLISDFAEGNGQEEDRPAIFSNGYAYPFISRWVLEQTLPFLSELSVFSYGFTPEGELLFPTLPDEWMIRLAYQNGTKPILTLTPFGLDGKFNNQLIHAVVRRPASKERLLDELTAVMTEKGYLGLDIDFEYILPEDRDYFTEFVRDCADRMHQEGFSLSVALAPKSSAGQTGLLYEGKDYRAIGEAADHVLIMTYEWGYTFGPPMAVAPLGQVRKVVEYAVTEILPEKISMGVPNYGYDWPLPYVSGQTRARTIGNIEAVRIAVEQGVPIQYDETAQSPFFRYTLRQTEHEVWFEDVRSLQRKFDLIREFGLRGPGYWQIMQLFRANWLLLNSRFRIEKL